MAKTSKAKASSDDDKTPKQETLTISPPRMGRTTILITGTEELVINALPHGVMRKMQAKQEEGSTAAAKRGKNREAKDFEALYEGAKHQTADGRCGIHAAAFRNGMISACRVAGFAMTLAKLSIFIIADGRSPEGVPLVLITHGEPKMDIKPVRNASGVIDLRPRPMWAPGWQARVTIEWDLNQFTTADVVNLLARMGKQVGVGEGRPDSKASAGCGWGRFEVGEATN
jgi:hypothetical protein